VGDAELSGVAPSTQTGTSRSNSTSTLAVWNTVRCHLAGRSRVAPRPLAPVTRVQTSRRPSRRPTSKATSTQRTRTVKSNDGQHHHDDERLTPDTSRPDQPGRLTPTTSLYRTRGGSIRRDLWSVRGSTGCPTLRLTLARMMRRKQDPKDRTSIPREGRYRGWLFGGPGAVTGQQVMLTDSVERKGSAVTLRDSTGAPRGRLVPGRPRRPVR
jgi:hypothetical protein